MTSRDESRPSAVGEASVPGPAIPAPWPFRFHLGFASDCLRRVRSDLGDDMGWAERARVRSPLAPTKGQEFGDALPPPRSFYKRGARRLRTLPRSPLDRNGAAM